MKPAPVHRTLPARRTRALRLLVLPIALLALAAPLATAQYGEPTPTPTDTTGTTDPYATETTSPTALPNDGSCNVSGMNMQCNEFGTIAMDSQRTMRGEEIELTANIQLTTNYADRGARMVLFSVRNTTEGNPVTVSLVRFGTQGRDIVPMRTVQDSPNELNLWVDVLDTPVNQPIQLTVRIGSSERGAFQVETLVMPFDRGYEPMTDSSGNDVSLFSFTLLGVNRESTSGGGGMARGLPAVAPTAALVALGALAVTLYRRR